MVDGLIQRYKGTYDIRRIDLSSGDPAAESLAQSYGVQYVPTFVFVKADGTVADTIVGEVPVSQLEAGLAKLK